MEPFRVRLNCIDHYQATPTRYDAPLRKDAHLYRASKESKVPVVRVFGSTQTGQKVCAHIHGAFPYLFVEYDGNLNHDEVGAYIYRLHLSIDHALAVSYRRDAYKAQPTFVARITLVKGIPFYGFHVGYRCYLKIYMLNPMVMTRLVDLLQQGIIMNRVFQPYEAHLQYLLQFMTDYNLYGCTYIEAGKVAFRSPIPRQEDDEESPHMWHSQSIPPDRVTDDYTLPRVSHCSIEVDICVQDILNRNMVQERPLHHDFTERLNPISPDMKLVHSMAGLWRDETSRRKRKMGLKDNASTPFSPDVLVPMSADPRDSQPQGWLHEDQYREQIEELIRKEAAAMKGMVPGFDGFVGPQAWLDSVNTALQSVEDLYPENLLPALGLDQHPLQEGQDPSNSIQVDEKGILEMEMDAEEDDDLFPDDSDEEALREAAAAQEAHGGKSHEASIKTRTSSQKPSLSPEQSPNADRAQLTNGKRLSMFSGLFEGVSVSGLKSGRPPRIPLCKALVAEARAEGLVTKLTASVPSALVANGSDSLNPFPGTQKRRIAPVIGGGPNTKRQKVTIHGVLDRPASAKHDGPIGPGQESPTSTPAPSSQGRKVLSTSNTAKSRGNHTLVLPIVKDPHDPFTKLRLSQQSNPQKSQDGVLKKHVTFDAHLPALDNTSSATSTISAKSHAGVALSWSTASSHPMPSTAVAKSALGKLRWDSGTVMFAFATPPPPAKEVLSTMRDFGLPDVIYQDAFYSNENDVPPRPREYAGREYRLESNTLPYLPEFNATGASAEAFGEKPDQLSDRAIMEEEYETRQKECTWRSWELVIPPPSAKEVSDWWAAKQGKRSKGANTIRQTQKLPRPKSYLSQIEGPTPKNKHGFKYSQKQKSTGVTHEAQYMSTMSVEVHVNTRGQLYPDPEEDEVQCIFWSLRSDESACRNSQDGNAHGLAGIVVLSEDGSVAQRIRSQTTTTVEVLEEDTELGLMVRMVEVVRTHDPDILTGYEVHGSSWGYLIERARSKYDYNLCDEFSRMKCESHGRSGRDADGWGFNTTSSIRVTGRHMVNIWRAMRGELNLLQYTMENVAWHLLHRRIPHYSWSSLTSWYTNGRHGDLSKLLRHYLRRTQLDLEILEANELIARTSEQARVLGVDFFSVFSRGSQFKVESIMFRIAKPENFMLASPSRKQVGGQNALECLPLVMEPQSAFYSSPLVVLDFQSLYPSVMIAYNYCYSTFLGRVVSWRGTNKMGFAEYKRQEGLLPLLKDHINIAPNGIMYVRPEIRKSLLAKMLIEMLETRVMVKDGMKQDKDDRTLQRLLNNRQLALKLLANVTYGYTSASFSGRMPCSEIADSIVQTGRETLERAIAYIHSVERWGAEVVYGDTDSLFVYLKGRTRAEAFAIGQEMARSVTDMNPRPVKLKFEKVYHPCLLLAKKRYVGHKYESPTQTVPEFDAKGIETVRRDGTPAEQKMEEKALKLLFETADLSQVKEYFQAQCAKVLRGAVSVQDFCFAREVKLGTYASANGAPPPPGALISTRRMLVDARAEPQYGERVPYVVITGAPGARLIDRCVAPEDLLNNAHYELDANYYLTKNLIPPLERIFNLVGANVRSWYEEMPKVQRIRRVEAAKKKEKATLESYMRSASCLVCGIKMKTSTETDVAVCRACQHDAATSMFRLKTRLNASERRCADTLKVCQSCAGMAPLDDVPCDSKDCPVFYTRVKDATRLRTERVAMEPVLARLAELEW